MKYYPFCKNLKTRVFDIETTGLYSKEDRIISASFINPDGSDLVQYFLESPQLEDILLEQILEELSNTDVVITYNGNMFDIPFVETRAKKNKVAEKLPLFLSLDIYRILKQYWPQAKRMPSLKQKDIEFAFGLDTNRVDEIGGGECIGLYNRFVDWNEEEAKNLILLHNADDVRQLARITEKLNFLPYHQIAFEKGFMTTSKEVVIKESRLTKTKLSIKALSRPGKLETDIYTDDYHLTYDSFSGDVSLDIFLKQKDSILFLDLEKILFSSGTTNQREVFDDSSNIKSGYLIVATKEVNYKDINKLVNLILSKNI